MRATATKTRRKTALTHHQTHERVTYWVGCFQPDHPLVGEGTLEAQLSRLTNHKGIKRVFMPDVSTMSTRRAISDEFTSIRTLENGTKLATCDEPADLVSVNPGEAFAMKAGGCLFFVATGGHYCLMGHAGRDSLVWLPGMTRTPKTIAHAIGTFFDERGVARSNIVLQAYFGLRPETWTHDPTHPEKGDYYQKILEQVDTIEQRVRHKKRWNQRDAIVELHDGLPHLNPYLLLKAQALLQDIERVSYLKPLPLDEDFAYTRHTDPTLAQQRNWVIGHRT